MLGWCAPSGHRRGYSGVDPSLTILCDRAFYQKSPVFFFFLVTFCLRKLSCAWRDSVNTFWSHLKSEKRAVRGLNAIKSNDATEKVINSPMTNDTAKRKYV